jgi:hypothetical protein
VIGVETLNVPMGGGNPLAAKQCSEAFLMQKCLNVGPEAGTSQHRPWPVIRLPDVSD